MNIFITGTETRIGKTLIGAGLATIMQSLGYASAVYKPIQTGAIEKQSFLQAPDLAFVKQIDQFLTTYCTYMLKSPAVPVISAEYAGLTIDITKIQKDYKKIIKTADTVVIEGTGGLLTPISPSMYNADIAKCLGLPLLIITRPDVSSVSNTLLAINYAKSIDVEIAGVIVNMYPENTLDINIRTAPRLIEEYSDTKVLGIIKHFGKYTKLNAGLLIDTILNSVDIEEIFKIKIPKLNSF